VAWANRSLMLLALVAALSCDDVGTVVPLPVTVRTVDLGGGVVATLGSDGSFSLASGPTKLVATAAGVPLLARAADPNQPDAWHDPTQVHDDLTTSPIDLATVDAEAVIDTSTTKALHLVIPAQPDDTALLSVTLAADDGFYTGLGEQFDHVSARGRVSPMFFSTGSTIESDTNEAHVPVPFLVSSRGWGMFVASREAGAFDVASTDPGLVRATFEGRALDVWFYVDPDPLAVAARFARQTGLPRPLPRWALSPMHWRNHWANTAEVISIANEYRTRHIPASTLWLDDGWQTAFNTFVLDPAVFGDPKAMMAQVAALGFRVLAWSTPYLEYTTGTPADEAQKLYLQAAASGFFVEDDSGQPFISPATPIKPEGAGIIDFTNGGARAFWDGLVGRATASGLHGFKLDYGEELIPALGTARLPIHFSDGTTTRTARLFPIEEHATYHAGLDAAFPGDGILIVRASSWGGATQADVIWPGDLDSGFQHHGDPMSDGTGAVGGLPAVVVDAQTLAASGFSAFGSDTAGYRGDPTRESLLRWIEHTALSIVMQLYGAGTARLPWTYDADAAAEYAAMATLHQRLEPYTALLVRDASVVGTPTMRALPLVYPGDAAGEAHADDEYMLGPDLLVAPVLQAGATNRMVHLPAGTWVHWWSDATYVGPTDVTVAAPLGQPPLFARAGGLVPMLPDGIDTLVDATAPGVVTLASQAAHVEARAWAMGSRSVVLDDGSSISVDDGANGVTLAWAPGTSARDLFVDIDVRVRGMSGSPVTSVATLSGAPLAQVADEAAVRAAQGGAWALDAGKGHAWVRLPAAGSARLQ
jgi:alpha-D-xyloside xylohydrolase